MLTKERYEIIKTWGNYLFLFQNKEVNQDNKQKLINILKKVVLTNEFEWNTDRETKIIHVEFALGKIQIQSVDNKFKVTMDDETKKRLKEFKEEETEEIKHLHQMADEMAENTGNRDGYSSFIDDEMNTEEKEEEKSINAEDEKEKQQVNPPEQNEEEEEEEITGESVFLDFLDKSDLK